MFPRTLPFSLAGFGLALLAFSPTANAHIRLLEPLARYEITGTDTGIKSCPCGLGGSNRTCNVQADGSDPDRSTRVTRAEAGSTITLRFEEYIGHSGSYRVAFDDDGADVADFNSNILMPLLAQGLAINLCLSFVQTFSVFPSAVLLGAPAGSTRVISIAAYQAAYEQYDASMASAMRSARSWVRPGGRSRPVASATAS